ncbi:hypothetical protein [Streptomyces sp. NPDC001135]
MAIGRGPLVYCQEQTDHPGGGLDDVVLDTGRPLAAKHRPDPLGGVTRVVAVHLRRPAVPRGRRNPRRVCLTAGSRATRSAPVRRARPAGRRGRRRTRPRCRGRRGSVV